MKKLSIKIGSVVDYKQESLPKEIWDDQGLLQNNVREFIYMQTSLFFKRRNFTKYQKFIKGCFIASSLGSYYYTQYTDFDIKFVIDCTELRKSNEHLKLPENNEELLAQLIDLSRSSVELTEYVPGTYHALDCYFYDSTEDIIDNLLRYDSLYSVGPNEWLKKPKPLPKDLPHDFVLQKAKEFAQPYIERISQNIEKLKIDSIDFMLLKDYIKNIDKESMEQFKYYVEEQLNVIDDDLDALIEDKELLKKLRKNNYSKDGLTTELENIGGSLNYGTGNIIFKVMQRYGYLKILNEIKNHFEDKNFTEKDLPILTNLLKI